jgi:hypothetical protein
MFVRKCAVILAVACASLLVVPVAASAKSTPTPVAFSSFSAIPVHGQASNGKAFKGDFAVNRFATLSNGNTYAIGRLTGRIGQRYVSRSNVAMLAAVEHPQAAAAATCPILHLVLGPLNLHLLGLNVHLNQVVLDITATSGPGNLLGNLLCDVANLLNGPSATATQTAGLMNLLENLENDLGLLNL